MTHDLLALHTLHITNITRNIIRAAKVARITPVPSSLPVSFDLSGLLQKALDLSVGLLTVYVIKIKWDQNKKIDTQASELLQKLEQKDREIERLSVEVDGWKIHHSKLTRNRHLH